MTLVDRMIHLAIRAGKGAVVVGSTAFSVVLSLTITVTVLNLTGDTVRRSSLLLAALVPTLIAPLMGWIILSMVFRIHHLESRLRELVSTDHLTGVMSRREFLSHFETLYKVAVREKREIAFVYLDIDHFKRVNDTHGHAGGDEALKSVARCLKESIRASDLVGRLGGEEFGLVLPNTGLEGAHHLAERLRQVIEKNLIVYGSQSFYCTISLGVAMSQDGVPNPEGLITAADRALYQAKTTGRNRTVASPFSDAPRPLLQGTGTT